MENWIKHPITLFGQTVNLIPLEKKHFAELENLSKDKRIWEFYAFDGASSVKFIHTLTAALKERENSTEYPFVIFHKRDNKLIGSTRFMDIQPKHKKLEIGSTWLHPDYWGTEINFECKLLLLTYCFEALQTIRVQLKTDENNIRSRKAIQKIGGQFEGVFRNDMIRDNNTKRNSAYFSIIDEEWEDNKLKLTELYETKTLIK